MTLPTVLLVGGCSHTWGQGLLSPRAEQLAGSGRLRETQSWPWQLNYRLKRDRVVSLAHPGTGLEYLVRQLRTWLIREGDQWDLGHSTVILQLPQAQRWEICTDLTDHQGQTLWRSFTASHYHKTDRDQFIDQLSKYHQLRVFFDSEPQTLIMKELTHLEALGQLAHHWGIRDLSAFKYRHDWLTWPTELREHSTEIITWLDSDHCEDPWVIPEVGNQWNPKDWDPHPSALGHRELARRCYQSWQRLGR